MKTRWFIGLAIMATLTLAGCAAPSDLSPTSLPSPTSFPTITPERAMAEITSTSTPTAVPMPSPTYAPTSTPHPSPIPPKPAADPFDLISQDSLFAFMEDLTSIQPYSGWRNSATEGEAEALAYVAEKLQTYEYLKGLGLDLERESFRVLMGTELWETRLHLMVDGEELEVPADGLRGDRDDIPLTLRFDSDGTLNDAERNPVVVEGPVVLIQSVEEIETLGGTELKGKVVFLDYAVIDRVLLGREQSTQIASSLLEKEPAGLVLVTRFSNKPGETHGTFVGDVSGLNQVKGSPAPPTLYVRQEDLALAGVTGWDDLAKVEAARLTWDADVFSPATSGNLVARIPGVDSSQAVILGAHIDSPNSPGAMDDGSGSVILLEVARVLNEARIQPEADLYLVWFGSEELWLYGSYNFVATHQELLDRTLAMLQIDMLAYPLEGIDAELNLVSYPYGQLGDERLTWPDYLARAALQQGVKTVPYGTYYVYSDNNAFGGFGVPHADLCYHNERAMEEAGGAHYASHIHDPYDTVEVAREVGDILEAMARVVLVAALDTTQEAPALRVPPEPDRRALFVASHTEPVHMTPGTFTDLGMTLAMEGFDVDMIPYGQEVTEADLQSTDIVIVLPVVDYPSPKGDLDLYDEAWTQEEIAALEGYVAEGGLLVLSNSAHHLKTGNMILDPNEDWSDVNALAERFGVFYENQGISGHQARTEGDHPLVAGISTLDLAEDNSVPFSLTDGEVLARMDGEPSVALVSRVEDDGQVLVLADVGIFSSGFGRAMNIPFWRNLAQFARSR